MVGEEFTPGEITLRPAVLADADVIANLHVRVWRETYRDLASPGAYAALTEGVRAQRWRATLADSASQQITLVAEEGGRLLGFGTACAPTETLYGDRGEIRWLHVAPEAARRGIGRRLMRALAETLRGWGYGGCALAVVLGNQPAIAFYERLGGRQAGVFVDPGPLWRSKNIVFVWDDFADLVDERA